MVKKWNTLLYSHTFVGLDFLKVTGKCALMWWTICSNSDFQYLVSIFSDGKQCIGQKLTCNEFGSGLKSTKFLTKKDESVRRWRAAPVSFPYFSTRLLSMIRIAQIWGLNQLYRKNQRTVFSYSHGRLSFLQRIFVSTLSLFWNVKYNLTSNCKTIYYCGCVAAGLRLGTHLFVKVPRPGDSEVIFSVFESSFHLLLPDWPLKGKGNPVKCLVLGHNKWTCRSISKLTLQNAERQAGKLWIPTTRRTL